jgi:hypothetical protein
VVAIVVDVELVAVGALDDDGAGCVVAADGSPIEADPPWPTAPHAASHHPATTHTQARAR